MKVIRILILLVAGLHPLLYCIPAYATAAPDSDPYTARVHANTGLVEDGDVCIYGEIDLPYATPPDDAADKTYNIQLIDTNGTTILGVYVPYVQWDSGYNLGAFGFYFSAADALTVNQTYTIRISQNPAYFTTPTYFDYTMTLSQWTTKTTQEDNQTEMAINIIQIAQDLETEHTATMLESSASGTVLSDPTGETYFRNAIRGIQAMAPSLFLVQVLALDTNQRAWATTQFDTYGNEYSGTWLGTQSDNLSGTFGFTAASMWSLIYLVPAVIGAMIVSVIKFRRAEAGYIFGLLVFTCCALMGWVSPAIFANVNQLFVIYTGFLLFYSKGN